MAIHISVYADKTVDRLCNLQYVCTGGNSFWKNFISSKDGPVKRTETRQRRENSRTLPYYGMMAASSLASNTMQVKWTFLETFPQVSVLFGRFQNQISNTNSFHLYITLQMKEFIVQASDEVVSATHRLCYPPPNKRYHTSDEQVYC